MYPSLKPRFLDTWDEMQGLWVAPWLFPPRQLLQWTSTSEQWILNVCCTQLGFGRNTVEKLTTMSQELLRNIDQCFTWSPESPTRSRSLLYLVDLEPGTTTPSMGWLGPNREVRAALQNHTPYSWIPQKCSGNPYSTWLVQNIHLFTSWVCACRWVLWAPLSPWWDRRRPQGRQTQSVCHSPKRWHT